ncbi:MAG TPA: RuBisCO large subunit C-terminal-like domain-containing protein [Gemmatimonadales bacterium]|nr:RuBisCO large subunit C-terminal-like domain-containing protein [Gemmatimonadales bacterium]
MLRATYHLTCDTKADATARARDIAREQTVEVPEDTAPEVEARLVGRIESLEPDGSGRWRVVIAYDPVIVGGGITELFNLLFGNISMKPAVRLIDLDFPESMLRALPGPRFGIPGIREICDAPRRPLVCTATKPLGLDAKALAELCYRFARAGADIVKDDHNLTDQAAAPFRERVERCQEAVERANRETEGRTLYFPNITGSLTGLGERLEVTTRAGCRGVLVNLLPQGVDAARAIGERGLVVLSHPTMSGAFFGDDHGIAADVLYGLLYRVIGSDGVVYTNVGGRFSYFTLELCEAINRRLRAPLGSTRPAFPVPGGGVDAARIAYWIDVYGNDTMFLIGSSLLRAPDLETATRAVVDQVRKRA